MATVGEVADRTEIEKWRGERGNYTRRDARPSSSKAEMGQRISPRSDRAALTAASIGSSGAGYVLYEYRARIGKALPCTQLGL